MHFVKSPRELSDGDMRALASGLGCTVGYAGKVKGQDRWDYILEKSGLTPSDEALIRQYGLRFLGER